MSHWSSGLSRNIGIGILGTVFMVPMTQAQSASVQKTKDAQGSQNLEEVVVTATRRKESLGHVPISVAAFSRDQMDTQGVKDVDDIALLTPGLIFTHEAGTDGGEGNKTQISIRGIDSTVGAGTTGIYIDDTPIQTRQLATSSTNVYPEIFDLERVEVLRGPQGTLFGAGAEGGVVRFITPQPSLDTYSAYARSELSYTEDGAPSYEAGVAGGGPLVDNELGFRASAWFRRDGGWINRVDPSTGQVVDSDSNSQDSAAFRLAMAWAPTNGLKVTPSVLYQDLKYNDTSLYWDQLSDPAAGQFDNGRTLAQPSTDRFVLPALAVTFDVGSVSLISNTSFYNRHFVGTRDYTNWIREQLGASPLPTLPGENAPVDVRDSQNNFTQELRLTSQSNGRLTWVIGAFYSHDKQYAVENYIDAYLNETLMGLTAGAPYCPADGCDVQEVLGSPLLNGDSYFYGVEDTLDQQLAGYGQLDFKVTNRLTVTAGARVADMKYRNRTLTDGPLAGGENASGGEQVEHPVTPKFGISLQLDPRNMVYTSVAKGFRPGGSNITVSSTCGSDLATLGLTRVPETYNSDSVWSYEVGDKSNLYNGRLQINSSLFWINWQGIQQEIALPSCAGGFVGNLGAAVSKGFDLQGQLHPVRGLSVGLSGGYTDAVYTETVHGGGSSIVAESGEPIGVPRWNGSFSGEYDFGLWSVEAYGRFDYDFISHGFLLDPRVYGYDPELTPSQASKVLNLRAGVILAAWNISAFANNVTNAHPDLSRGHDTLTSPIFTSYTYRPLTIGVTAIFRY